ncbi:MAG: hypothetical protein IT167_28635 [Bryobacterales bacterium]|nr:hypothetical protein [Bryobacterales bacterium]
MPDESTVTLRDRRERYRAFMRRFNPSAPAELAINDGLVCDLPGQQVYKKLAARADLVPGSRQLLVGGIGSGKSTQLLLTARELSKYNKRLVLYMDVSAETDLSKVNSGALLAILGMRLADEVISKFGPTKALIEAKQAIGRAAYGYEHVDWGSSRKLAEALRSLNPPTYSISGILNPPFPPLERDLNDLANHVSVLVKSIAARGLEIDGIFDGLDRLLKPDQFWRLAEQDLRAVKILGISVVITGPLSLLYGAGRQVKEYFDEVHHLPPAVTDPKKSLFLVKILRARGAEQMMDSRQMEKLSVASGGVLRDLISLAHSAGEAAYLDDSDYIEARHVDAAIEQLGNGYLLGLGTMQMSILRGLLAGGGFNPSDPEAMELLVTRRVLERQEPSYEVHPALKQVFQ